MKREIKNYTLKLNFPKQICVFERGKEKVHCNVDLLINDCTDKEIQWINVADIFKKNDQIVTEYAMNTENEKPIIVIKFEDGTYEVLDGHHRLHKAYYEGKDQIMSYVLTEDALEKYII